MKFISFYTGHYEWDAEQLLKTLNKFKLDHSVEPRQCTGKWTSNTQLKAQFILEKLKENDAVVWTDADSRIIQQPTFFDTIETDVSMFHIPQYQVPEWSPPDFCILQNPDKYLQSGTMYFKSNERTIKLVERWIEINAEDPRQWDQWTLQKALEESDVTFTPLPAEYNMIEADDTECYRGKKAVILHTQASRRFKSKLS